MADLTFEHIKPLVEQMPADEMERLREWLNSYPEQEAISQTTTTPEGHWGKDLNALINAFDLDEADQLHIDNVEEWVRERRRLQTRERNPGWGAE